MKRFFYNWLFTSKERYVIQNALAFRSQSDFYQNSLEQNKTIRDIAKDLILKIGHKLS
jgi:hypothetical protein